MLPLHPSMELDVREHAFLAGTHSLELLVVRIKGLANVMHGGEGHVHGSVRYPVRSPGCCFCTATAMCSERTLRRRARSILVEPGGFLYKDSSVTMNAVKLNVKTGLMSSMYMAEVTGPGRVGIQSMYVHHGSG